MIEWILSEIVLEEKLTEITLNESVAVTLDHYDPPHGIEWMTIGSTFIVGA